MCAHFLNLVFAFYIEANPDSFLVTKKKKNKNWKSSSSQGHSFSFPWALYIYFLRSELLKSWVTQRAWSLGHRGLSESLVTVPRLLRVIKSKRCSEINICNKHIHTPVFLGLLFLHVYEKNAKICYLCYYVLPLYFRLACLVFRSHLRLILCSCSVPN